MHIIIYIYRHIYVYLNTYTYIDTYDHMYVLYIHIY